jgi:hypothetical protein
MMVVVATSVQMIYRMAWLPVLEVRIIEGDVYKKMSAVYSELQSIDKAVSIEPGLWKMTTFDSSFNSSKR